MISKYFSILERFPEDALHDPLPPLTLIDAPTRESVLRKTVLKICAFRV
jgi:hypothetical protein